MLLARRLCPNLHFSLIMASHGRTIQTQASPLGQKSAIPACLSGPPGTISMKPAAMALFAWIDGPGCLEDPVGPFPWQLGRRFRPRGLGRKRRRGECGRTDPAGMVNLDRSVVTCLGQSKTRRQGLERRL